MNIENALTKFWHGEISLWKAYWIIGELLNSIVIIVIFNIELKFFDNSKIFENILFLNLINFHFMNKLLLTIWTIFITVGIWRSAEKYKGSLIWIILTLIILSYRIFVLRIIFY